MEYRRSIYDRIFSRKYLVVTTLRDTKIKYNRNIDNGTPIPVLDKQPKISTMNKRKWSAMEHNIDQRIGKLNLRMYSQQEALQHPVAVKLLH